MREPHTEPKSGRCSAFEFPDIKSLLQRSGCLSGRPLPGQRLLTSKPLSFEPRYPSILRKPGAHAEPASAAGQRRVKFDLPPSPFDLSLTESLYSDDGNSDCTISQDFEPARYIGKAADAPKEAPAAEKPQEPAQRYDVRRIPSECLQELIELGTLDRMLVVFTRDIGRLSIENYQPFRSLYFHSVVLYHLGKTRAVDAAEASRVCESAVILNNATAPSKQASNATADTPNLLAFLRTGVSSRGRLIMPVSGADEATERTTAWANVDLARMNYSMVAGHQVAHLEEPAVKYILARHIEKRCLIRPVYHYMYRQFLETKHTDIQVVEDSLQFQIYSTVLEVMEQSYGARLPLSYVMYTTLFAIAETNELIINGIIKSGNSPADVCISVLDGIGSEDAYSSAATGDLALMDPLCSKDLLGFLDWDFAAVIGHLLAHRYHSSNEEETAMRARLGALAFGVDTTCSQPYPPVLPLQDTQFHQYIHRYVALIYSKWPHGFVYMVIEETVSAYNTIIQTIREQQNYP
ncbi:hypothetical protein GGI07_005325 [Coemansia sp. Benny D115]|nr:hypothetical protein GGI07_005325 [Coemansia sp. Benny D115]